MEENECFTEIKEYLISNAYPPGFNEDQKCALRKLAEKFEVIDGVLHRSVKGTTLRVVTSTTERFKLVKDAHLSSSAGRHNGRNKTIKYIRNELGCYWKNIACDVQSYVLTCQACNTSRKDGENITTCVDSETNWRQVAVQILGPFFKTDDGCQYVAVAVDPVSCWVEGGVLKSLCSKELSAFLFKTFTTLGFCQHTFIGVERELAEETNHILNGLCTGLHDVMEIPSAQLCTSGDSKSDLSAQTVKFKVSELGAEMQELVAGDSLICNLVKDSMSNPSESEAASTLQNTISLMTHQSEINLKATFGPKFSSLLELYTQSIHSLVESNPLTWDKELARSLFQLRVKVPQGFTHSGFYAMFHREPFPKVNKRKSIVVCDQDSDSDTLVGDDESDSEAVAALLQTEPDISKEIVTDASARKKQKTNTRGSNRETRRTYENDVAYIPSSRATLEIKTATNCSSSVTSRYGLRTNLKAKGDSSMVERFLRLSSAKRSLPPTDAPTDTNSTPKRRRKSILSHVSSPVADENGVLKIKEEQVDELGNTETESVIMFEAEHSTTESASAIADVGAAASAIFSTQEPLVTQAVVVKVPEQVSLLKCNQPSVQASRPSNGIEMADEPLQVIPKEVHVTIVADNDVTVLDSEQQDSNVKSESLSDEEYVDLTSPDHTSLVKKRRKKIAKSRKMEKELPHKCPKCVATYLATPQELQLHLDCHVPDEKLLRCPHCPKTVRNWSHLQRHLLTHDELAPLIRNIPEDKRKCTFCGKVFSTREGMLRHEQVIHKQFHRFECRVCGRKYKERKTFKRHMDLHANVVYKCDECKYKTKIRRNLIDHNRIHEGRGFQCDVCSKIFTKQSILMGHMEIHNVNRSTLICEQCGMKLANAASLRQHVRNIHEKPGRFPCEHCDYIGKTKGNLMSHMDRAHNKPFKCPHCSYSCKSDSALKRHTDIFHNLLDRRFPCSVCPYRARDPKQLSEHMRFRHNPNALRFPCQFCSMKFKTMTTLRHHLPAHTGQHLYSCQLCGYSAKYRQTVHHHVKVKHPGQRVSNVVKGTPCSEIPCSVLTDAQIDQAIARVANQECTVYMPEGVVIAEHEPGVFVAKILETVKGGVEENMIAEATDVNIITADEESITIPSNSTIELQFITEEENGKNIAMKIVPTQEQTEKAVELLLLAMDPHQTVTEVVSEETVHTTE